MNGICNAWYYTDCSPQNSKELFNLRHSSLRNAIERIFGVLKKRFRVLTHQLEYSYEIQVRLVKVICCLHNIIRLTGGDDWFDEQWAKSHADTILRRNSLLEVEAVVRKAVTAAESSIQVCKIYARYDSRANVDSVLSL
jgi:hypothetical protein